MTERAVRLQLFHQLLERQILMAVCTETNFSYTRQQLFETRVAAQVGP